MKVLMINKFFYPKGGSEKYLFDLRTLLAQNGHQVLDFSMADERNLPSEYSRYFIKNVDFSKKEGILKGLKKAVTAIWSFEANKKLTALIKEQQPDLAHLHNFNWQLTPSILFVLKKYKIPVVWTLHDYKFICPNFKLFTKSNVCQRCRKTKFYNCFLFNCINNSASQSFVAMLEMYVHKVILKSYDLVGAFISPSKFLVNMVMAWGNKIDKFTQIYNCLNLAEYIPANQPGQGLLYFGRLSQEKGLAVLLEAMKSLPDVELKIVGEGPQKAQLLKYIESNSLANVSLIGYKNGQELYDLIRQARLVVVPSIWYENNPISVLEAMALAKPILGAEIGGISELLQDGQTGLLCPANDTKALVEKINSVYQQVNLLQQIGTNARKFVEANCNYATHYQQIIKVYQKLAKI